MRVIVTKQTEVTLSPETCEEVFLEHLNSLCGGDDVYLAKDGSLEHWTSYPHGSGTTTRLGTPSDVQRAALQLRSAYQEALRSDKPLDIKSV